VTAWCGLLDNVPVTASLMSLECALHTNRFRPAAHRLHPHVLHPSCAHLVLCDVQVGYAVVFLSRKGSCQPFINHLPPKSEGADFVNFVPVRQAAQPDSGSQASLSLCSSEVVAQAHAAIRESRLLTVHFTTVFEYLKYLEVIAQSMQVSAAPSSVHADRQVFAMFAKSMHFCKITGHVAPATATHSTDNSASTACRCLAARSFSTWRPQFLTSTYHGPACQNTKFRARVACWICV
jgi:hypothetical protein